MAKRRSTGVETLRQFTQRLHREGLFEEWQERTRSLMDSDGLTLAEARDRLASEFGAPHGILKTGHSQEVRNEDGNYIETLNWVAGSLGWLKEGRPVSRLDAPGSKAWGLFQWASQDEKSQDKFWAMWSACNKRAVDDTAGVLTDLQATEAELLAMLEEVRAESERV
jgi:hypothetical protein